MSDSTHLGGIAPQILQLAHPEIYARLAAGKALTAAQADELKCSVWLYRR